MSSSMPIKPDPALPSHRKAETDSESEMLTPSELESLRKYGLLHFAKATVLNHAHICFSHSVGCPIWSHRRGVLWSSGRMRRMQTTC